MAKINMKQKILQLAPYFTVVLAITGVWFFKSGYLFFTDMVWGPNMVLPVWTSGWIYLDLIIKGLSVIIPVSLIEKLFLTGVFGVILFGGYKIAQSFSKNKAILFLGSVFALFNSFVYDRLMYGQVGIILGYGFFLAAFGYLISFYFEPLNKKQLFLGSVFAGFSILFAPHFVFFLGLTYFVFGTLIFLKLFSEKRKKDLLKVSQYFLLGVLIVVLINFNWIFGVVTGSSQTERFVKETITEQDLEVFKTSGSSDSQVLNNVLLMSGFWGKDQHRYADLTKNEENWGRSFYFLLPIIILGLIYNFKDKKKRGLNIGLILIYLVAFVLALGIALPITAKITLWLFNNVPFYKGLREPQKWVAVMIVVYEVLLVCGLTVLSKKKVVVKNKELLTFLLTFVIILQAPLMVWGGAGQVSPIEYPKDWYEVDKLIVQETNCESKILFLPWHLYMSFNWIGSIVANPSAKFFKCPMIYGKNMEFGGIFGHSTDSDEREVEEWVFNVGRTNLLEENKLNISYIILAKEIDWQNYLWLGNHHNVEFVKETENLIVYKVKNYEDK